MIEMKIDRVDVAEEKVPKWSSFLVAWFNLKRRYWAKNYSRPALFTKVTSYNHKIKQQMPKLRS
jgi:hypothetical protein